MVELYFLSYALMVWCLIKHGNFTLPFLKTMILAYLVFICRLLLSAYCTTAFKILAVHGDCHVDHIVPLRLASLVEGKIVMHTGELHLGLQTWKSDSYRKFHTGVFFQL